MAKILAASLVFVLSLAAPAWAACVDEVAAVEDQLSKGDGNAAAPEGQQAAVPNTTDAQEAAVAPPGYSHPQESWHGDGTPVAQLMKDAKELAQDGNEEACLEKLERVKRTLEMAPASQNQ